MSASPGREEKPLRAALALGVALRLAHFLRDPSIWNDEAALVLSALNVGFAGLLGPLPHSEAAPPLFVALVLFVPGARRFLSPAPAALAVLLLAVSDRLLWHAVEAKPYSSDVLVAVVGLRLFVAFEKRPGPRPLLLAAASFPSSSG